MKKSIFLGAAMLLLMAACSNDENNNGQEKPTQAVQFSFTNEDFGADETLTRATSAAETKPQIVDLGDCEAEISVESEPAVKTRGTLTNANGHYTIRAYQSGTLKGEVKGTFSGGAFTADANSRKSMRLPDGTYDFVAFNDDVVPSGTELTVAKDKAATAMMGTTTELINQHPDQKVNFTMKHVGCRLRTQFVCQKDIPNAITATLEQTAANVIPTSMTYNILTKAKTYTNGAMAATPSNSPASAEEKYMASYFGRDFSYTSSSNYHYFLPTTESSKLKLTGIDAGTVFWKPIPTFNVPKLNATLQMQAGKSYCVKIKLKPNYTYLMSDGTLGFFKETTFGGGSKTPVALVLDKTSNMAMALNTIGSFGFATVPYMYTVSNTHRSANLDDALNGSATSGLDETWNSSYSTSTVPGNKVKALNPQYPAFKAAAEYDPGTVYTGSPALQWYLPSYNDFKWILPMGFGDKTAVNKHYVGYWYYGNLVNLACTQVGGNNLVEQEYVSSTEQDNSFCGTVKVGSLSIYWSSYVSKNSGGFVRPFVKY